MDDSVQLALVTGASGFVGSHVAALLAASGIRVRCLVRHSSSLRYLPVGAEIVYGELATGEGLDEAAAGADIVLHAAGITKASNEAAFYRGNLQGTRNLLAACERAPLAPRRFVHVSSLAAVGPSRDGTPICEDAPPRPLTWYGESKLAAEEAVRGSAFASRSVILRPRWSTVPATPMCTRCSAR